METTIMGRDPTMPVILLNIVVTILIILATNFAITLLERKG